LSSQVISDVKINGTAWATTPDIPLKPGLVAIICGRVRARLRLVDVIAAGYDAFSPSGWDATPGPG
jgi:hypothetical protein